MEKTKYYIIGDVKDLEMFLKIHLFNFNNITKLYKQYNSREFKFIESKNMMIDSLKENEFVVIYSNDTNEYLGWNYVISSKKLEAIDVKVYLRKYKLGLLNGKG